MLNILSLLVALPLAAKAALDYVEDGMILGVGTGSTINLLIELLPTVKLAGAVASSHALKKKEERKLKAAEEKERLKQKREAEALAPAHIPETHALQEVSSEDRKKSIDSVATGDRRRYCGWSASGGGRRSIDSVAAEDIMQKGARCRIQS